MFQTNAGLGQIACCRALDSSGAVTVPSVIAGVLLRWATPRPAPPIRRADEAHRLWLERSFGINPKPPPTPKGNYPYRRYQPISWNEQKQCPRQRHTNSFKQVQDWNYRQEY